VKTFEIRFRRYCRREGLSNWSTQKIDSSTAPAAIAKAVRVFLAVLSPKERRDAARSIQIKCARVG
jgi:hypothetical protein